MKVLLQNLGNDYAVEFWVWNGLQQTLRPVAGWLFSRGQLGGSEAGGEHLGIAGPGGSLQAGRILLSSSGMAGDALYGSTVLSARRWHHVVMTRAGDSIKVYVNGKMEISGTVRFHSAEKMQTAFFGGLYSGVAGLEGRMDEIAIYNFPLSETQVRAHFEASASRQTHSDPQTSADSKASGARSARD
jgi:hypothetical protein